MNIYCGIDFGTTNTVVSICGKNGKMADSFSIPTTIFIPEENHGISKVCIGNEAVRQYEEDRPGRYIHSIKRSLSDIHFRYTVINRTRVTLEDLMVLFLTELKKIISDRWAFIPENIVLGRPVRFSTDKTNDQLAKKRLKRGFELSGFRGITILEEPVAASLCFEEDLTREDRKFLIMDLGGGTSDFTLVSYEAAKSGIDKYIIDKVGGIDIGGDNFDEDVMLDMISPLLGSKATFESYGKRLPMPVHIYRDICRWNKIRWYDKKDLADEFADYLHGSTDPAGVRKLKTVIESKLSQKILEKTRLAKHSLNDELPAEIRFNEGGLDLVSELADDEFSRIISGKSSVILSTMDAAIGGCYNEVDKVILTGGSSRIKQIQNRLSELFSADKILHDGNFYNSISKGLALYAYYNKIRIV